MEIEKIVGGLDWPSIAKELNEVGVASTGRLLTGRQCAALRSLYPDDSRFRSHVVMKRHGFGEGEYKYFSNPLPEPVASLREAFYPRLAAVANEWHRRMGIERRFPATLRAFSVSAMPAARRSRRRCSSNTGRATTTACTRTSMASTSFRSNSSCS